MIVSVSSQVYVFFCTVIGGMAIALVYDFFRIFRKAVKTGGFVTYIQDLIYWIVTAVIMFLTFYYSNDGELRVYLFIGAFIGVVMYSLLLSKAIMSASLFIIKIVTLVIKALIFIISYPIRLIWKILAVPLRKLVRIAAKSVKKTRSSGRVRFYKLKFFAKTFRNIKKKI
jgi:spore cortex biosynthesis protein YabQ